MNNNIVTIILVALVVLVVLVVLKPKREGFFYYTESPTWVEGTFGLKSALFMASLSSLGYDTNTKVDVIQKFMDEHRLYYAPQKNNYTDMNTGTSFTWATSVGNKDLYIAFQGEDLTLNKIKSDMYQTLVKFPPTQNLEIKTSYVFTNAWMGIRSEIFNIVNKIQPNRLYITGYGFGGAIATLAAFDLKYFLPDLDPIVYTFAAPRVGDVGFAMHCNKMVNKLYRVQNKYDPIPRFPTTCHHVKDEILLDKQTCGINAQVSDNWPYNIKQHSIFTYITTMQHLMQNGTTCITYTNFPRVLTHCTGGNSTPAIGYKKCIY